MNKQNYKPSRMAFSFEKNIKEEGRWVFVSNEFFSGVVDSWLMT